MALFNYILLVRLNRHYPSWEEIYVMAYVTTHATEMIREVSALTVLATLCYCYVVLCSDTHIPFTLLHAVMCKFIAAQEMIVKHN